MATKNITIDEACSMLEKAAPALPRLRAACVDGFASIKATTIAVHQAMASGEISQACGVKIMDTFSPINKALYAADDALEFLLNAHTSSQHLAQEAINLAGVVETLNTQFAKQRIRVPRPAFCALLPANSGDTLFSKLPQPTYDVYHTDNAEASVLSRLRFQISTDGNAVGVVVLATDGDEFAARNSFEFQKFIPVVEGLLRRRINLDNPSDSTFLYTTVLGYAVALADTAITMFGPLTCTTVGDGERSDVFSVPSDTVSDEIMFDGDDIDINNLPTGSIEDAMREIDLAIADINNLGRAPAPAAVQAPAVPSSDTGWANLDVGADPDQDHEAGEGSPVSDDPVISRVLAEAEGPEEEIDLEDADADDPARADDPDAGGAYEDPDAEDDTPVTLPAIDDTPVPAPGSFSEYANAGSSEPLDTTMDQDLASQLQERQDNAPVAGTLDAEAEDEIAQLLAEDEDPQSAGSPDDSLPLTFTVDPTIGDPDTEPGLVVTEEAQVSVDGGDADVRIDENPLSRFAN
jgi:hypothetical protein